MPARGGDDPRRGRLVNDIEVVLNMTLAGCGWLRQCAGIPYSEMMIWATRKLNDVGLCRVMIADRWIGRQGDACVWLGYLDM